jgi:uncharacterized membrane protein
MDLLIGTFVLRPYVFGFLAAFLVAGAVDLGWRRTLRFASGVWPLAWLAEFSSTRTGVPFGLYHYTQMTRGQELFLADVPLMDSLSFTFLAYASFCLARAAVHGRAVSAPALALVAGVLMMLLDVVIDPIAVRGDRWFLGRIFYYPDGGVYFGVPLSNFVGWIVVGTLGVGIFYVDRYVDRRSVWSNRSAAALNVPPAGGGFDAHGRRVWPGMALYYVVLGFNLFVTAWIGEWLLLSVGVAVHAATAVVVWNLCQRPTVRLGLEKQQA